MPLEDGTRRRDNSFGGDFALGEIERKDVVNQLEVLETHGRPLQAPLAATSSSMRALRFLSTKYWSVVALPSLTSCVHCSSGSLMPNALSMAKAMSRKSRLSISRSLMAWLSGLIFSRGMSQVSAMISATLSNVVDIRPALFHGKDRRRPVPAHASPTAPGPLRTRAPRIAKDGGKFNGGDPRPMWRRGLRVSPCAGYWIAAAAACDPRLVPGRDWRHHRSMETAGRVAPECGRQGEGIHAARASARRMGRFGGGARAVGGCHRAGAHATRRVAQNGAHHRRNRDRRMRQDRQQRLGGGGRSRWAAARLPAR